jgi:hypothetical protein
MLQELITFIWGLNIPFDYLYERRMKVLQAGVTRLKTEGEEAFIYCESS